MATTTPTDAAARVDDDASVTEVGRVGEDAGNDASGLGAQVPSWASPLVGHYAFRTHGLSKDRLRVVSSGDELWLGEIFRDADGLAVRADICQSTVTSSAVQIVARNPGALGVVRRRILLGDHVWSTDALTQRAGYMREVPPACVDKPDQVVKGVADATWRGMDGCRCPISEDAIPTLDDCRVIDSDGDLHPGLTVDVKGPSVVFDMRSFLAINTRTHFRDGQVDPTGAHTASLVLDTDIMQLSCEPAGCSSVENPQITCTGQPPGVNLTRMTALAPTGLPWTCADVLARANTLFPTPVSGRDACEK